MKNFKIKSYCKINLSLRVLKKLKNNYHSITSLITFSNIHDTISISKNRSLKDKISFYGRFKKGISKKSNTVSKVLDLLRKNKLLKNQYFKINIKKNIPHGSGLGGGSSNAAALLKYFKSKIKSRLSEKKMKQIASQVGFDVPINLERQNVLLTGKKDEILRLNKKFNLNLLIVYPNIICSTRRIYTVNKKKSLLKKRPFFSIKNNKKLITLLKDENNDLEETVVKIYPKVKKVIDCIRSTKGCYFSRITGSGSACIGIFSNMKNAIYAQKLIKLKYPKYWCAVSKTI